MILKYKILTWVLLFFFISCSVRINEEESVIKPRVDVMVTHPVVKDVELTEEFQGITRYIQSIGIRAHIKGIITKVNVSLTDKVIEKQPLFEIKPREASLLESAEINSEFIKSSADTVFAFSPGIVSQINVQTGDFVQEGDLLANCIDQRSLRVIVYVPLETNVAKLHNQSCKVYLPNGNIFTGIIGASLPSVNETDQTSAFLVKLNSNVQLAENIHVKIKIKTGKVKDGIFLPNTAIYGNEEQNHFWILKIQNDSIAVRIPVQKGIIDDNLVQVSGIGINVYNRFLYKGGYALPDSALVNIVDTL